MTRFCLRVLLAVALAVAAVTARADARLETGTGSFVFQFLAAGKPREIVVWYHYPAAAQADAPIVFVMHGTSRTAQNYRKYWIPFAEAQNFVLLVPEFSREQFPRDYNVERMTLGDGTRVPRSQWPYAAIERIFDAVREGNGLRARTYDIYGHSAGGQFVHRLVLLMPEARFRVAVAANSGWYTMPDLAIAYPYGLAGTDVGATELARALQRKLIVLVGDRDIDPNHPQLRRTPEAAAQGEHRFQRGHTFFEQAQRSARKLDVELAWELHVAPGVAHSNARMAPHAAKFVGAHE
jgi:poly(3-hydroxybutyrate) depolymerase